MAINEKLLIPDTAIEPSFNTVIYTGNSSTNSITGVGFKPDLVWIKNRTKLGGHWLTDSVRGVSRGIMTQSTSPEITALPELMSSFNSDGFTVGYISNDTTNISTSDYVAWCFKAGGAASLNEEGTIDSQVSVNNDLGFSIATYTATGVTATVGHGLDAPPEMIIAKTTNQAYSWVVYHKDTGASNYLILNSSNTSASSSAFMNNTSPTSSVFTAGAGQNLNYANNDEIVAYNFTSKTGVSKVSTYTGTGTSGNVITTGFEPAFVIIKNTDDTGNWMIYDNVRDTDGVLNKIIYANLSNAEATATTATITPNTNGFTIGNSNSKHLNRLNDDFIYYAIADI